MKMANVMCKLANYNDEAFLEGLVFGIAGNVKMALTYSDFSIFAVFKSIKLYGFSDRRRIGQSHQSR